MSYEDETIFVNLEKLKEFSQTMEQENIEQFLCHICLSVVDEENGLYKSDC